MLDLVHRRTADLHGPLFPENRDGSLEVLGVREHRDLNRPERAASKLDHRHAGVLRFDFARQRRRLRHHTLDRADEPLHQVDVMRCLIQDGATVKLPRSAPRGLVVVLLWTRPPNRRVRDINPAEPPLVDRLLEQLHRGIQPVLLDNEKLYLGLVARAHECVGTGQRYRHRFFANHVFAGSGRSDSVGRVQPARRGHGHHIAGHLTQHGRVVRVPRDARRRADVLRARFDLVADRDERQVVNFGDRIDVAATDPAAPNERDSKRFRSRHVSSSVTRASEWLLRL